MNKLQIIPPLSTPKIGRQYQEALPLATEQLCGPTGTCMAVGFSVHYIVFRGTFDRNSQTGSWNYLYSWNE